MGTGGFYYVCEKDEKLTEEIIQNNILYLFFMDGE